MRSRGKQKVGAVILRIILFANLVAIMAYGAITPDQLAKVTAECITIGFTALAMAVQVYATIARYTCLPGPVELVIGLDSLCAIGWIISIIVLSYWDRDVVYIPRDGDPAAWLQCANAKYWDEVLTSDGVGHWIHLSWCKVDVDGRERLIGNGAARTQLHVLIGLSAVSLFFTGLIIFYTVKRAQQKGLIRSSKPIRGV